MYKRQGLDTDGLRDYTHRQIRRSPEKCDERFEYDDDICTMRIARKAVIDNCEDGISLKEIK